MQLFLEQLINGCALGSLYALFGLGFGLVFATLGILNAAHGCYASWAAISALWAVEQWQLPFVPALLVGIAAGAVLALVVDRVAFEPLRRRGNDMLGALITSIAFCGPKRRWWKATTWSRVRASISASEAKGRP